MAVRVAYIFVRASSVPFRVALTAAVLVHLWPIRVMSSHSQQAGVDRWVIVGGGRSFPQESFLSR